MRETLEDLYYGNITPYDRQIRSGTSLMKAMEQSQECEGATHQTAGGRSSQSAAAAHQRGERDRQHAGSGEFHPGLPSGSASDPGGAGRGRWQSGGTAPPEMNGEGNKATTHPVGHSSPAMQIKDKNLGGETYNGKAKTVRRRYGTKNGRMAAGRAASSSATRKTAIPSYTKKKIPTPRIRESEGGGGEEGDEENHSGWMVGEGGGSTTTMDGYEGCGNISKCRGKRKR